MAVQEFGIPSGFEADLESIAAVTAVKRTETEDRKVILYFDQVEIRNACLSHLTEWNVTCNVQFGE